MAGVRRGCAMAGGAPWLGARHGWGCTVAWVQAGERMAEGDVEMAPAEDVPMADEADAADEEGR